MKKTYLNSFCARCLTLLVLALMSTNLAWGTDKTVTWTATSGGLGSEIGSGTIKTGDYSWDYTRTLKSGSSYSGWTENCIQLGKNGGVENVTFSTSNIPGAIKSVSIECSSYNNAHKVAITVGNTTYTSATATAKWTTVGTITGTGTSSGTIEISVTDGTRAFYVKSISVIYEEAAPTSAYTVTFNAGTNGSCSTTELTEASAGAGVTLPSCTANTGYVFKGWSTTEGGTTPDAGVAGETYKPSNNCTLYAIYNALYTVTIETPENGTLVVKDGGTPIANGKSVEDGTTLTIEATPTDGYKFRNWQAIDASTHTYTQATTYTINAHDVTFKANFDAISKYTINYMINGVNTGAQENVYEGTALEFPVVNDFGGKVFVGWSETEIAEETDIKPTLVETTDLTATANATYYAVFATLTKGDFETKTDVLNLEFTGVEAKSTYSNWSKSAPTSDAVYAGNSAGDKNSIQLRTNNSNSGIVSTTTGGSVKKITVEWHEDTQNERTLDVYGSNSAYSATTDLYDNTKSGTLIGTIVKGTSTELSISGEYTYIGLRSNSSAMYLTSISIEWQQGTPDSYSAYCTSVAPRTQDVEIITAKYATLGLPYAVTIPEGVSAYTATVEDTKVTMTKIQTGKIPANCGVILYAETPGTYTFTETANVEPIEDNQLVAVTNEGGKDITGIEEGIYFLSTNTNGVVFKLANSGNIPQYKAYLQSAGSEAKLDVVFGDPTGINTIDNGQLIIDNSKTYNLQGVRVNNSYKGIVIMNGKKYINK